MNKKELIDNSKKVNISESEIIQLRDNFTNEYVNEKGWDKNNLTFEQVMEIRSNVKWKNPHLMFS